MCIVIFLLLSVNNNQDIPSLNAQVRYALSQHRLLQLRELSGQKDNTKGGRRGSEDHAQIPATPRKMRPSLGPI